MTKKRMPLLAAVVIAVLVAAACSVPSAAFADLPGDPAERMKAAENIVGHTPDKYLICESNSDCMVVPRVCGGWLPVNKAQSAEFTEAVHTLDAAIKCLPHQSAEPSAKCFHGRCVLPCANDADPGCPPMMLQVPAQ